MDDGDYVYVREIKQGEKIFCESKKSAYKLQEEFNKRNIETRVGCNEAKMWSVYVIKM